MKHFVKVIASLALILAVAAPSFNASAQRRGGSKARKTAVANKKTSAAAKPLSMTDIAGNRYMGIFEMNGGMGVFSIVNVNPSNHATYGGLQIMYGAGYQKISARFKLSGNKIEGNRSPADMYGVNGSSTDGGKSIDIDLYNSETRQTMKGKFIKVPSDPQLASGNSEEIMKVLTSGKYTAYLQMDKEGNPELAFPVTISFKEGEENTWKISYNQEMLMQVGGLKGTFTLDGSTIKTIDSEGGAGNGQIYENGTYGYFKLGDKSLPGGLDCQMSIVFIKQ